MNIRNARRRKWKNRAAMVVMSLMLLACLVPLASMMYTLLAQGLRCINWDFLVGLPLQTPPGVGNAILGSLLVLLVASCFSVPLGLLVGLYLSQGGEGRLTTPTRTLLDVMSGTPAIVVGMFINAMVVRPMQSASLLAGGVALAMIMLPIFARTTEEAVKSIPATVTEAGLALGLPRRRVVMRVVLRGAIPGVLTGFFLALARVGGEAAPLLFTVSLNNYWPSHAVKELATLAPLREPVASLPVVIYEYAKSPFAEQVSLAWGASLLLVVMILSNRLTTHALVRWQYGKEGAR